MNNHNIWKWGAELRPCQSDVSEDHQWFVTTAKMADMTKSKVKAVENKQSWEKLEFIEDRGSSNADKVSNFKKKARITRLDNNITGPWNKSIGGYMFICCNETMEKDIKMQLFCLPLSYCDSVRKIAPGMPLFLYNETTRKLHGVFEATSYGGYNIDSTAWEDVNCKGRSKFPAQVRIRVSKLWKPLEENAFRPVLQNYCDPTVSFELSVAETLALLYLYEKQGSKRHPKN